jgi:hypothetical protein
MIRADKSDTLQVTKGRDTAGRPVVPVPCLLVQYTCSTNQVQCTLVNSFTISNFILLYYIFILHLFSLHNSTTTLSRGREKKSVLSCPVLSYQIHESMQSIILLSMYINMYPCMHAQTKTRSVGVCSFSKLFASFVHPSIHDMNSFDFSIHQN